jgi:FAD/FMN-containing dehydrogenase
MKVIYPDNTHYEEARVGRVFNRRRPERFPNAIVYAESEADVVMAVNLARERGWKIAMRSGGHSWAAWSVREEGLLLDLSLMREMQLDTATNIVRVSPAIKGGAELNPYLAEHGLMFHGGHCPTVGLGGFLLQGGMGWNCRGWGWAAEAIEAIHARH